MIKGLYETHLFVEDLNRSVEFYKNILKLKICYVDELRKLTFFWVGNDQEFMLGLWEKPKNEIQPRHFAFRCDLDFILNEAVPFLKSNGLNPYNFLKNEFEKPMVFAWMPAISIYFHDPDGHELEFISILPGKAIPQLGVISYEEWLRINC